MSDARMDAVRRLLKEKPHLRTRHLATVLKLSKPYLRFLFRKHAGMQIGRFGTELQLNQAKELMDSGWTSIKEIRLKLGIKHAANFTRAFKKRFGISPSEYLRETIYKKTRESAN